MDGNQVVRSAAWRRALLACLLVALLVGVVAACGGGDDDEEAAPAQPATTEEAATGATGGEAEGAAPVTLRVGVIPIADVAPLFLGIREGFFDEEGLQVEPEFAQGGAVIVPSVLSGDFQIGFSNTISLLIAATEGLPVEIVTQGVLGGQNDEEAWAWLMTPADGPIKTPQDLEGKRIAVNTLKNICEVTIKASLEQEGVDVSTLELVEMPFPDMNAALEAGQVDAACEVEPFVSQGEAAGMTGLLPFYVDTAPDLTVATYFTTQDYIESNPDVVERFARAMNRSLDFAAENPDAVREVIAEYTEIPPEAIEQITLPTWRPDLSRPTIERLAELSVKYGLIEEAPDLDTLIWEGAEQ